MNGAPFLQSQLESFRTQSHPNWELLVSDDGSTDGTLEIVHEFAASVGQQVTLCPGPRAGFWQNFVFLVRSSSEAGDYFAYSDQDDVWNPEKLARAIDWLATIPPERPALYFTRTELTAEDGSPCGFSPLFVRPTGFQNALVQNIGGGNTMIFNRAARALLCATPADMEIVSHDWWTYQIVSGGGGATRYDPWPSVKYRQHGRNLVGSNAGVRARMTRLREFSNGRFREWNNINIAALRRCRHLLTAENARVLDLFAQAREAPWTSRVGLLQESGVYRQSALDDVGMFVGLHLGLM
jgi:glycosyltransferase involved in cell wall biosynthesis